MVLHFTKSLLTNHNQLDIKAWQKCRKASWISNQNKFTSYRDPN